MTRLTKPVAGEPRFFTQKPMDPGFYRFQVTHWTEWPEEESQRKDRDVLSICWTLTCLDEPYEDREKRTWTTYWASDQKINQSFQKSVDKYLKRRPGKTPEEAADFLTPWNPIQATLEILWACGLMEKDEDNETYVAMGWQYPDDLDDALMNCLNKVIWVKIGPDKDKRTGREFPDTVRSYSQMREK